MSGYGLIEESLVVFQNRNKINVEEYWRSKIKKAKVQSTEHINWKRKLIAAKQASTACKWVNLLYS